MKESIRAGRSFQMKARITLVAAAGIILYVLGQSSATAALPGHELMRTTSTSNSSNKSVTSTCPASKKLSGTGYSFGGSLRHGKIYALASSPSGTTGQEVTTEGAESENVFASNWTIDATGICTSILPGYQVVEVTVPSWSTSTATAVANCPGTKVLIGTGAQIMPDSSGNGPGEIMLTGIEPSDHSVSVTAQEDSTGTTALWSVKAYAFCADASLPGYEIVPAYTSANDTRLKFKTANCAPGKGILGVGGVITNQSAAGDISLSMAKPVIYPALNSWAQITADGRLDTYVPGDWFLAAYAICATL